MLEHHLRNTQGVKKRPLIVYFVFISASVALCETNICEIRTNPPRETWKYPIKDDSVWNWFEYRALCDGIMGTAWHIVLYACCMLSFKSECVRTGSSGDTVGRRMWCSVSHVPARAAVFLSPPLWRNQLGSTCFTFHQRLEGSSLKGQFWLNYPQDRVQTDFYRILIILVTWNHQYHQHELHLLHIKHPNRLYIHYCFIVIYI